MTVILDILIILDLTPWNQEKIIWNFEVFIWLLILIHSPLISPKNNCQKRQHLIDCHIRFQGYLHDFTISQLQNQGVRLS